MPKPIALLVAGMLSLTGSVAAPAVELTMGSWRTDAIEQWNDILAVFQQTHPDISITFQPTNTAQYLAQLRTQLEAKTGPDIVSCKPFDDSLDDFSKGYLADLTGMPGLENFPDSALVGWQTDDKQHIYCVPVASVLHGYFYNKDIFEELSLTPPKTVSEFLAVADKIKAAGRIPLASATKTTQVPYELGFNLQVPNFCDGENGRQALIAGTKKFTDQCFVDALSFINKWSAYMPDDQQSISLTDLQQLFLFGETAIFPSGSWEVASFAQGTDFEVGAFPPVLPDGADPKNCWLDDHVDMGIGMNAFTQHPEEVKVFLEWLTTAEFAQLFGAMQPGSYSLSKWPVVSDNELNNTLISWRDTCKSTIRLPEQILSRGTPAMRQLLDENIAKMVNGEETPEQLAQIVQDGLASWYVPQQSK